ncbi:tRNA uridine-5-carboxymethylaminomethyl(34) synthesis GTPase MnmE [Mycoplasmopsis cricetuli]|uniref:tRNA uridine-5-carboxymethylaminomethyl(34) synthesis GTPase MnmE n=1 Tax=Mycoplasmopsis cricetuli TaxID=171283 RepID=UPI000471B980|nr:tRNA uridine-5-carboxymethylaminomethyl(34) synthesis GTPase MnmE [Mycoplasmopsis cricetuli]
MYDNIAAISSGNHINQPIGIIRLSGPDAVEIIKKIFKGKIGKDHQITYGYIYDHEKIIDEVLIMWFVGSEKNGQKFFNNYVGEPLIEINCHGGIIVMNQILELLLKHGARLAEKGEFTRRAFLNGKMSLIKAEAIHDLIFAQTTTQAQASISKFDGKTNKLIDNLISKISYLIGLCEVNIDYPEYTDYENVLKQSKQSLKILTDLEKQIQEIIYFSENSRYIFEGVKVAIVGKPNVGKSSILNALLNEEKAIVTDIAGTTRDIIEASYQIQGILFKLVDTAGIRKTTEKIETIGIEKSFKQISEADVVIHVTDVIQEFNHFDQIIEQKARELNKVYLQVLNKSDLLDNLNVDKILISAKKNDIDALKKALIDHFSKIDFTNAKILSNTRQLSLIKKALIAIQETKIAIENEITFDIFIIHLYDAWDALKSITGQINREDLLDDMFANFCLGK